MSVACAADVAACTHARRIRARVATSIRSPPLADAQAWAIELSQASSTALALAKGILNQSFELSAHDVFAQGSQAQGICYTSSQHRASVEAFLAKSAAKE